MGTAGVAKLTGRFQLQEASVLVVRLVSVVDVPPTAFDPPPRVDSAVVRMVPLAPIEGINQKLLGEIVTVAFYQRRKLLRHTLGAWLTARGVNVDFNVTRRAEEVPVAEYLALAKHCQP